MLIKTNNTHPAVIELIDEVNKILKMKRSHVDISRSDCFTKIYTFINKQICNNYSYEEFEHVEFDYANKDNKHVLIKTTNTYKGYWDNRRFYTTKLIEIIKFTDSNLINRSVIFDEHELDRNSYVFYKDNHVNLEYTESKYGHRTCIYKNFKSKKPKNLHTYHCMDTGTYVDDVVHDIINRHDFMHDEENF